MGDKTEIEWADGTINFAWGCTHVSAGCKNCYMFRQSPWFGRDPSKFTVLNFKNIVKKLRSYKKKGIKIIFVNSMTDTFHKDADLRVVKTWFDLMKSYPEMEFLVLTKRIAKAKQFFDYYACPENVWIGTSIENRGALHRLQTLKKIQAGIRFVSFEPLLAGMGDIDLSDMQWVIVGGESGAKAKIRPFDLDWARKIRDQCAALKIPYFYKQSGGFKKEKGVWGSNVLDGKKHLEMPVKLSSKESSMVEEK